jgi:hypothetical protein
LTLELLSLAAVSYLALLAKASLILRAAKCPVAKPLIAAPHNPTFEGLLSNG